MLVTTVLMVTTAVLALFLFTIFLYHLQIKNKILSVVELVTIEKLNTRDPEMTKDLLAKESCVWAHAQTHSYPGLPPSGFHTFLSLRTDLCEREGRDKIISSNMEKRYQRSYNTPTDSLKLLPLLTKLKSSYVTTKIKKGIL